MSKEELNAVGHMLLAAGSDEAIITLNRFHTELLGLLDCGEIVEVTQVAPRTMGHIIPGNPAPEADKKVDVMAVEPVRLTDDPDETPRSYKVVVGVARKALNKKIGGKRLEGCRQPDAVMPVTQDEPASV